MVIILNKLLHFYMNLYICISFGIHVKISSFSKNFQFLKSPPPPPPPVKREEPKEEEEEKKEEPKEREAEISEEVKEPEPMWTKQVSPPAVPTTSAYKESLLEVKNPEFQSDSETSSNRDLVLRILPDARDVSIDEQIDLQPIS